MRPLAWISAGLVACLVAVATTPPAWAQPADSERRATPRISGAAAGPHAGDVRPAALDLDELERRLRDTSAIGLFTKISLRNQIEDLVEQFRRYHNGGESGPLWRLRERFDLMVMKVLSLLQDRDPVLARDIAASREALWGMLADPRTFATLSPGGRTVS